MELLYLSLPGSHTPDLLWRDHQFDFWAMKNCLICTCRLCEACAALSGLYFEEKRKVFALLGCISITGTIKLKPLITLAIGFLLARAYVLGFVAPVSDRLVPRSAELAYLHVYSPLSALLLL